MINDLVLHAKVSESHMQKLEQIKRLTGLTNGAIVRQALDALKVVPARFEAVLEVESLQNEKRKQ